jgi:hypothetical protein
VTIDTVAPSSTITFPANGGSYQSPAFDSGCGSHHANREQHGGKRQVP